jgi:hypothetical protein
MTKLQFIELVRRRLTGLIGVDQLSKFAPQIVEKHIGNVYDNVLFEISNKGTQTIDSYSKVFKAVPVLYDSDRNLYYSELPAMIAPLSYVADGVVHVSTPQNKGFEFVPIKDEQISLIYDLEVSLVDDVIPYTVVINDDSKLIIEYSGTNSIDSISDVTMKLVISFESYNDNDQVRIPNGQAENIIKEVINILTGTPKVVPKNDNTDMNYGRQ